MAIDLIKNRDSLTDAYERVLNEKDDANWALFGYEGQTPILKVVKVGDGGVEELIDEVSSGKMMYVYCRIRDPNTGLFKFVLIHWTGEGVPENIRLRFTSHLRDLQSFLRSIHLTVPARYEDDIDKDDLANKVAKLSGTNCCFHRGEASIVEPSGPVGTNYQQTVAAKEINSTARHQFWAKAEKDECARQKAEKIKHEEEKRKLEAERRDREMQETKQRDKIIYEHMREVNRQRQAELRAEEEKLETERKQWERNQEENKIDEEERKCRSDRMTKERTAEAAELASFSASNARNFFKKQENLCNDSRSVPQHRKIRHTSGDLQGNKEQELSCSKELVSNIECESSSEVIQHQDLEAETEQITTITETNLLHHKCEKAHQLEQETELEPVSAPLEQHLMQNGYTLQPSTTTEDNNANAHEVYYAKDTEDVEKPHSHVYHGDYILESYFNERQFLQDIDEVESEEEVEDGDFKHESSGYVYRADYGKCARAIYDYQADDDTEISFDPDDVITNIEEIDEGWWQGFGPDGSYGMFPANYVELLEQLHD